MKPISAFDVIGPNMIGPSSSHTAGALRIAQLTRKLLKGELATVKFTLYGSFAHTYKGHGTDRALAGGILGFTADDSRIRDSLTLCEQRGITVDFLTNTEQTEVHPNTVDIDVITKGGEHLTVRGVSIGGGRAELRAIDGVAVELSGEYSTIFIRYQDEPGVITHITGCLSEQNINIAFMRVYREGKGCNAYAIIEADEKISESVVKDIKKNPAIQSSILIE